ncbi:GntR family transcriptional regulator [Nocardioides sp. NPDC023903]|uniref:GntR family transcriptional regulator n=1 Tax=Nocardioides sp. NPDC023903 TaxID=3157195 RepID=UPI0033EEB086
MPSKPLAPVARLRLADLAYQALRRSIIDGSLEMGERLKETEIAEELQMSRAPVREAIQRLAGEGLVVREAHLGAQVLKVTAEDVADLYNVRLSLETAALRLYLANGVDKAPLSQLMDDMKSAAANADVDGVVAAELNWHRHIVEASGSALIRRIFGELEGRVSLVAFLEDRLLHSSSSKDMLSTELGFIVSEHDAISEAIIAADDETAVALFERHFHSTVIDLLKELGGDPSLLLEPMSDSAVSRNSEAAQLD